jgi:hypothetical protein
MQLKKATPLNLKMIPLYSIYYSDLFVAMAEYQLSRLPVRDIIFNNVI